MNRRTFGRVAGFAGAISLVPAVAAAAQSRRDPAAGFRAALLADGPDPAYARELMTYGRLVGSWRMVSTDHRNGKVISGESHFGWVMRGRAVQDIWISDDPQDPGFGTTVRVYRPELSSWRISFSETLGPIAAQLDGRPVGDEIVETSVWSAGDLPAQWIWSDITPNGFHWRVQLPDSQVYLSSVGTRIA